MCTDQFSNDYHTAHISSIYYLHSYKSLKGRDTPADRPRNELEEEETVQYSQDQVHHSGTAARSRPNG